MTPVEAYMRLREKALDCKNVVREDNIQVMVQLGKCSQAAGAMEVIAALEQTMSDKNIKNVTIVKTGCMGLCSHEPIITLKENGKRGVTYCNVTPERARIILNEYIAGNTVIMPWTLGEKDVIE